MNPEQIEAITAKAVCAALDVIDQYLEDTNKREGPCGDVLASDLHTMVRKAIRAHFDDRRPTPVSEQQMTDLVVCKKCGSALEDGFCVDVTCPFSDWPQRVELDDLCEMSRVDVEDKYGIKKREPRGDAP